MTQDDVIRFAREAGMEPTWDTLTCHESFVEKFEAFARLVAEHERERIMKANKPELEKCNAYIQTLEQAIKYEREACAKLCEAVGVDSMGYGCARVIRARGEA